MGRQLEDFRWLLIKSALILYLMYYFHHQFTTEATGNHFEENVQNGEECLNLNDRMSKAEFTIRNQGGEIAFLKTTVLESTKIINQLSDRLADLGTSVVINNEAANDGIILERQKRPYRLIPVSGKEDKFPEEKMSARFDGPPTNCNQLEIIGYTLNGYYLVKGEEQSSSAFEAVFCRFKQPQGLKYAKEERFRLFDTTVNLNHIKFPTTMQPQTYPSEAVTLKTPFYCNNQSFNHNFHLKNEERNTCMGFKGRLRNDYVMEYSLVRWKCDNSSELQWVKDPIPQHKTSDGSMVLCNPFGDACLTADWKLTGEYHVKASKYVSNQRSQKWKVNRKTGQLINIEAQLCLTSYSNRKTLPNAINKLPYRLETCSDDQEYIIAQQKWSLIPIPSCDDDKR